MLKSQVSRVPWPGKNRIQTGHAGTKGPIGYIYIYIYMCACRLSDQFKSLTGLQGLSIPAYVMVVHKEYIHG